MRCGTLTFPTYRLVPDARWHLADARIGARSAMRRPTRRRGLRARPEGAAALRLRGGHVAAGQPAESGLRARRAARRSERVSALLTRSDPSRPLSIPSASSRSHSGRFCARAVCAERPLAQLDVGPRPRAGAAPAAPRPTRRAESAIVTARSHVRTPFRSGEIVRRPSRAYLRIRYGQRGVVELGLLERARCPTSARRISRAASSSERRPSQTRFGAAAARLVVRVVAGLALVPLADQQQHQLRHALGDARAAAPSRCGARDARATRRRRSRPAAGAGKESAASGTSSGSRRPPRGRGRPARRRRRSFTAARRLAARCSSSSRSRWRAGGVVGDLVAVPAPVPELGVRVLGDQPARERILQRVEDDDRARDAGQPQPPRLGRGEPVADRRRQPQVARRRRPAPARRRRRPGAVSRSSAWSRRMNARARAGAAGRRSAAARRPAASACAAMRPSEYGAVPARHP